MKARVRTASLRSPASPPSYLKPGALAQLRNSKITARSKQIGAQTLLALCQLNVAQDSASPQPRANGLEVEAIPCFNLRVKSYPRCLQRKKLVAFTPFFYSETQS